MPGHTVAVGLMMLALVPLIVVDTVNTYRAGFNNAFWQLPLDDKLDRIVHKSSAWKRLSLVWVLAIGLMAAGFTAFTFQMGSAGESEWAGAALGLFLVSGSLFLAAVLPMTAAVDAAARDRAATGTTPPWLQPSWDSAWWAERAFVVGANLAYVAWGAAILRSGFPADWVGWLAVVSGGLIALWATFSDYFFQHMALLMPIALGVALILY